MPSFYWCNFPLPLLINTYCFCLLTGTFWGLLPEVMIPKKLFLLISNKIFFAYHFERPFYFWVNWSNLNSVPPPTLCCVVLGRLLPPWIMVTFKNFLMIKCCNVCSAECWAHYLCIPKECYLLEDNKGGNYVCAFFLPLEVEEVF